MKPGEGVALWAVSVDTAEQSRGFSDKIAADGRGGISFPLVSDPGHSVIDAYGLQDPRYAQLKRAGIPWPTVYVIDRMGRVAWSRIDKDFKQRPLNEEIRAAIDAVK